MYLSEFKLNNVNVIKDGYFECLAQCTINYRSNILSFLSDNNYVDIIIKNKNISCIICKKEDMNLFTNLQLGILISENPQITFFELHNYLAGNQRFNKSIVDDTARISKSSFVSEFNVEIGKNVVIEDNVVIKDNVIIGDNSIVRSGSVIGGQGFEFKRNVNKEVMNVKHVGKVIIGSNVEIKEFATIHQALFDWDYTKVDDFSKLDAHTHIGHASKIGKSVLIGSHANIAGNVIVNDEVFIGPSAVISNRITIGNNSIVSIGSVVTKNVPPNSRVTGNFAIEHSKFLRFIKQVR